MRETLAVPFVVGITGHKKIENGKEVEAELYSFFRFLDRSLSKDTPIVMLSSLASGADREFVKVGRKVFKRNRTVVLVYVEAYQGFEDELEQQCDDEFLQLKKLVSKTIHANGNCDDGDNSFAGKSPLHVKHKYFSAGEFIRLNSNIVVAVWDGRILYDKIGNGGTGDIVNYCLRPECYRPDACLRPLKNVPIWVIHGKRSDCVGEYVLPKREKCESGLLRYVDGKIDFQTSLERIVPMLKSLSLLNEQIHKEWAWKGKDCFCKQWAMRRWAIARVSDRYKSRYSIIFGIIFFLTAVSGFFAQIFGGIDFVYFELNLVGLPYGAPGAFLGAGVLSAYLILSAVSFFIFILDKDEHINFGDFRAVAEVLRVKWAWAMCGIQESVGSYVGWKTKFEQKTGINVIRNWEVYEKYQELNEGQLREVVNGHVLKDWLRSQWKYFKKKQKTCWQLDLSLLWVGRTMFILSFLFATYFCYEIWGKVDVPDSGLGEINLWCAYGFLVGIGPFVMSCTAYYRSKRRWRLLARNYAVMSSVFSKAHYQLTGKPPTEDNAELLQMITPETIKGILKNLGIAALGETSDWIGSICDITPTPTI